MDDCSYVRRLGARSDSTRLYGLAVEEISHVANGMGKPRVNHSTFAAATSNMYSDRKNKEESRRATKRSAPFGSDSLRDAFTKPPPASKRPVTRITTYGDSHRNDNSHKATPPMNLPPPNPWGGTRGVPGSDSEEDAKHATRRREKEHARVMQQYV